jgi:glycosyltransferase involved in cell wall biosynthesis
MRCPNLAALPSPPSDKTDWPWAKGSSRLSDRMPDGSQWPRISIVTPSLNQGSFIEETIRSVLLQGYPNIEYIIIDGGSTDGTQDIIKKYEPWLAHWISEQDRGQSHAINKGFARATGNILAYINSDDLYEICAFEKMISSFSKKDPCHLWVGECAIFENEQTKRIFKPWWPQNLDHFLQPFGSTFAQPASFWTRESYNKVNGFDESLNFIFDREFFLKLALQGTRPCFISKVVARYREHPNTKTSQTIRFYEESIPVVLKYAEACGLSDRRKKALLKQIKNEIRYFNTFIYWKEKGRLSALSQFIHLLLTSPTVIFDRKILGLARRLICFRAEDVLELKNV